MTRPPECLAASPGHFAVSITASFAIKVKTQMKTSFHPKPQMRVVGESSFFSLGGGAAAQTNQIFCRNDSGLWLRQAVHAKEHCQRYS